MPVKPSINELPTWIKKHPKARAKETIKEMILEIIPLIEKASLLYCRKYTSNNSKTKITMAPPKNKAGRIGISINKTPKKTIVIMN